MNAAGKNYKLCASRTAAELVAEVNGYLAQGWELYGHPFADAEDVFCQAVVCGKVVTVVVAPAPVNHAGSGKPKNELPLPQRRKQRPRVAVSFGNVAGFLAIMIGSFLLLEAFLFRSGWYAAILEPESGTGAFQRITYAERTRKPTGRKEVLVVGSRMLDDFSAKIANGIRPEDGYWFINAGTPYGGVRSLYYLVRDVDPNRNRYEAIMVPIDDYDDPDVATNASDLRLDLYVAISRLGLADIVPFASSFPGWRAKFEAFRGALLKGMVYQGDFQAFLEDPGLRIGRAKMFRESGTQWLYDYGGLDHSMAGGPVDGNGRRATGTPQTGRMRADQVRWIGALADRYRDSKTRVIIYQIPRGPAIPPYARAHPGWTTVDELAKRRWVKVVDRHRFEPLETPERFADPGHLNRQGRAEFTSMLVALAKEIVH